MATKLSAYSLLLFILYSCGLVATRPKLEMAMANQAFIAAKQANAQVHAPSLFSQAESFYQKAKSSYKRKYFNKAKDFAKKAQYYSEKAEEYAIKKTFIKELQNKDQKNEKYN